MNISDISFAIICSTVLIFMLLLGLALSFFISGRQKALQEAKLTRTQLMFEQEIRKAEHEVREQVMSQLAQELHDNIGQLLTGMHFQLENKKLDHPGMKEEFKPLEIYLSEATQQLRLLSRTLNNEYLLHLGLAGSVQLETERLKTLKSFDLKTELNCTHCQGGKDFELIVFRIFQEIIQNIQRHAQAKNVFVKLYCATGVFELLVSDDGVGFDPEKTLQSDKASGLRNILKRASLAGLHCQINSAPSKGCRIQLSLESKKTQ